ncbi:MAG: c-type cytochrome [Anaerolineales bacterium]|nr:c-type cytochrome [Anaerolineales bacterium]
MKKFFKWVGLIAAGLLGIVVLSLGVIFFLSEVRLNKLYQVEVTPVAIPSDAASIAEGKRLFATRGCGDCHKSNGAGGDFIDDPLLGRINAANLTTGQGGRVGSFSDDDWVRAIRHGVGPDGKPLWIMPSQEFNAINDKDLGALIAYIKSLPAVDMEISEKRLGPLGRALLVTSDQVAVLPAERIDHAAPRPAAVEVAATVEYGAYQAQTCVGCHGPTLSGGAIPGVPAEPPYPANLTPNPETGLGTWTEADFVQAIRTGVRPDGSTINPTVMPWPNFAQMSDTELSALWLYLQSIPAKPEGQR